MGPRYTILTKEPYTLNDYTIVSLRQQDIEEIRLWRNDQLDVLRQQKPISTEQQLDYYYNVVLPTYSRKRPELVLFSILRDKKCIGYGGLVHINWQAKRAEVSFLTSLQRASQKKLYDQDFTAFLNILKTIAFTELGLQRLTTETFDIRPHVISILEKNGFIEEGRMRNHNFIGGKYVDSVIHGCLNQHLPQYSEQNLLPHDDEILSGENILVTSISQKIPLLKSIKSVISDISSQSLLIGCDADPDCLARSFVDIFWNCPTDSELDLPALKAFCIDQSVKYIIPTRDGELLFYAEAAQKLLDSGIHVMISAREAVAVCLDKKLFSKHLSANLSVPIIPTNSNLKESFGDKIVVKERRGSGSKHTFLNLNTAEAIEAAQNISSPVFQPYIKGNEYSIDMYLSLTSEVIGVVVRSRDVVVDGESKVTTISENIPLENICKKIAAFLRLTGHVVFQAIIDEDKGIHILECNCRIGGASTLSMKVGLDSIRWFIEECRTGATPAWPENTAPSKMRMIRISQDTFHGKPTR